MSGIPAGYEVVEGVDIATFRPMPRHILLRWLKKVETKGGVLLPQNRQRAGFMKGQVLAIGPDCDPKLTVGALVEFNGLSDKEWLGVQDPADRDTVFCTRVENVLGLVIKDPAVSYPIRSWREIGIPMVLEMVGTWILVQPDEMPGETAGILVPPQVRRRQQRQQKGLRGQVLCVGGQVDSCAAGDRVAFEATNAVQIHLGDHNDEVALVIDDIDVLALEEAAEVAA